MKEEASGVVGITAEGYLPNWLTLGNAFVHVCQGRDASGFGVPRNIQDLQVYSHLCVVMNSYL